MDINILLEKAKESKPIFKKLKDLAVSCQSYEIAANLRDIELSLFPESEEVKKAKNEILKFKTLLRMLDVDCDDRVAYLFIELNKIISKNNYNFTLKDAESLLYKRDKLFSQF